MPQTWLIVALATKTDEFSGSAHICFKLYSADHCDALTLSEIFICIIRQKLYNLNYVLKYMMMEVNMKIIHFENVSLIVGPL